MLCNPDLTRSPPRLQVLDRAAQQMPLGRLCDAADIGKAAVWFCSDEAAYVTGAQLTVDGGQFIETAPSWTSTFSATRSPVDAAK